MIPNGNNQDAILFLKRLTGETEETEDFKFTDTTSWNVWEGTGLEGIYGRADSLHRQPTGRLHCRDSKPRLASGLNVQQCVRW